MAETKCSYITGQAGTGKTTLIKNKIIDDPRYGILSASTGIAAVNLNTVTVHSLLKFYDLASLKDAFIHGRLIRNIKNLAQAGYKNLILDEVSMFSGEMLDILVTAFDEVNTELKELDEPQIGLVVVGDFLQLPAIKAKFAFESKYWNDRFEPNTTKLTKVWRQDNEKFLNALNAARAGNGRECAQRLVEDCGVQFYNSVDENFNGTTIMAKNEEVDRHNKLCLLNSDGEIYHERRVINGVKLKEWETNIPEIASYKIGSYVMLLVNKYNYSESGGIPELVYANGDCGVIKNIYQSHNEPNPDIGDIFGDTNYSRFDIELVRNGALVSVGRLERHNQRSTKPDEEEIEKIYNQTNYVVEKVEIGGNSFWSVGSVEYMPIRLAYASSVHRTQGLSLDKIQIDIRNHFFSAPAMLYVALSRCRTAEGLRIIGSKDLMAKRCSVDAKVKRFA